MDEEKLGPLTNHYIKLGGNSMIVKAFKNGNFNVKAEELGANLLEDIMYSVELDFQIFGDEGCASNYDMYYPFYNSHTDLLYLILGADVEAYKQGRMVKLVGRELDEDERAELESEVF